MSIFKFNSNFISKDECDFIIKLSKDSFIDPSKRIGRPNRSTYFHTFEDGDCDFIDNIKIKISKIINKSINNISSLQVNRYRVGEGFPPHYDYDGRSNDYTFLIYLNDDFIGGETYFPSLLKKVSPEIGRAIYWTNSVEGTNELEYLSLHEALTVEVGEKWMIVAFIKH